MKKSIIGRNLKSLREANGYTQEQLSDYLAIKRSAYANYEAGERETPLEVLQKAADLFGCELALLFEEDDVRQYRRPLVVRGRSRGCVLRGDRVSDAPRSPPVSSAHFDGGLSDNPLW